MMSVLSQNAIEMRKDQLFSVIILSYNNEQFIYSALDSVLNQDYPKIEIIVADDSSSSFHKGEIEGYIRAHSHSNLENYYVFQNADNLGTVKNANNALRLAKGEYIKVLGADDMLYDPFVLRNAQDSLRDSHSWVVVSQVIKCTPSMQEVSLMDEHILNELSKMTPQETFRALCVRNIIPAVGVFFKREFFDLFGLFDEEYKLLEDWPTWLRFTRQGNTFGVGGFIGARYRYSVGAASNYNATYIHDKELAFEREIKPYRLLLGKRVYIHAFFALKMRNSKLVRQLYFSLLSMLRERKS